MTREAGGVFWAVLSYGLLGLTPLFWKNLKAFDGMELLAYRVVWTSLCLGPLWLRRSWRQELGSLVSRGVKGPMLLLAGSLLMAANWYGYVRAVATGHVLDASLAYFLTPLVSVGLGVAFFRERVSAGQSRAMLLALGASVLLVLALGHASIFVVGIAASVSLYGAVKKRLELSAPVSVATESLLLLPLAILTLVNGSGRPVAPSTWCLLAMSGPVTALPLILYAEALKRMSFVALGFLFYLMPALQFLLAVFVYNEPLSPTTKAAVALIWLALALFVADLRRRAPVLETQAFPLERLPLRIDGR